MKWRLVPNLNLDIIEKSKILLIGAGTLGCYVARALLAWGVKEINFVDSGSVSYSNPNRQPLYTFEDAKDKRRKAITASDRLKEIDPNITSDGYDLMIPMPGHHVSVSERESILDAITKLEKLIQEHNVIYILTDSRESRWLPTMLCAKYNKICINVALGFDSYLVMRHGVSLDLGQNANKLDLKLGCYFCNDIVAPQDSLSGRTLDQQCTVTRPGLAPIASALAVELLVSILQNIHVKSNKEEDNYFAIVPHQIRGFLSEYKNLLITGPAFDKCTACSNFVIDQYNSERFDFLFGVFDDPNLLIKITGLAEMLNEDIDDLSWDSQ